MAKEVSEELKQRLAQLRYQEGWGYERIAKQITLEFPHKVSHMWVKRYFDKHDAELGRLIVEDNTVRDEYRREIKRTAQELKRIEEELWSCYGESDSVREKTNVLKVLLDKVRASQAQQKKITDNITKHTTVNIMNISEQMDSALEKMPPEAIRKILEKKEKKTLEEYA